MSENTQAVATTPNSSIAMQLLAALNEEKEREASDGRRRKGKRFDNIEAEVRWDGEAKFITLPGNPTKMSYPEAKVWLERLEAADNEEIAVHEIVDAFPFDGAIAFMQALKQTYGWATPQPPRSFFEAPPTLMSVDVSPTEKVSIIWGRFAIPGISGTLMTSVHSDGKRFRFAIQGSTLKKHAPAVAEIAELTRQIVRRNSIYRGKGIKLAVDGDGDLNLREAPTFLDLSGVREEELVYSTELTQQVQANLWTPIEQTAACRKHKIPLKRGVLLEGPYGTGKTLAAYVTARKASEHGWTFITVDRVTALKAALQFAQMYQPAVVFVEDIDREVTGERSAEMDDILNTIDGVTSKNAEVVTVLTSNHAADINPAMLRPGRLDAILSIQPPDAEAAEKLMRIYGRGLIPDDAALAKSGKALAGRIPAVIRECVERAKLFVISRVGDGPFKLTDQDIASAAAGMQHHLKLLAGKQPDPETAEHKLGAALAGVVAKTLVNGGEDSLYHNVKELRSYVEANI